MEKALLKLVEAFGQYGFASAMCGLLSLFIWYQMKRMDKVFELHRKERDGWTGRVDRLHSEHRGERDQLRVDQQVQAEKFARELEYIARNIRSE